MIFVASALSVIVEGDSLTINMAPFLVEAANEEEAIFKAQFMAFHMWPPQDGNTGHKVEVRSSDFGFVDDPITCPIYWRRRDPTSVIPVKWKGQN